MGSKTKRAARETPYRAERDRVATLQKVERCTPRIRDYDAMTITKMTVPGDINKLRSYVRAPVRPEPKVLRSVANAETVARWAAEHALRVALSQIAEKDRKAAYRKLHTPIAGNPAKRTGGID